MPAPGSIFTATCVIAQDQSLSTAADCSAGTPRMIVMPQNWNYAGGITFQASPDGVTFYDVFKSDGQEVASQIIPGAGCMVIDGEALGWAAAIKIRSGTLENPVTQVSARQFQIILQQ